MADLRIDAARSALLVMDFQVPIVKKVFPRQAMFTDSKAFLSALG